MRIYFYDGYIDSAAGEIAREAATSATEAKSPDCGIVHTIDAVCGPTACIKRLAQLDYAEPNCSIFTNSLTALDHTWGWDDKHNCTNIYLWSRKRLMWVRVDDAAGREIRPAHNIMYMYLNGAFDADPE